MFIAVKFMQHTIHQGSTAATIIALDRKKHNAKFSRLINIA